MVHDQGFLIEFLELYNPSPLSHPLLFPSPTLSLIHSFPPPPFPSFMHPSPSSTLPFPIPPLHHPSPSSPSLSPFPGSHPLIQLWGLQRCKLPSGSGQSPATKRLVVLFELKRMLLVIAILKFSVEQIANLLNKTYF